MKKQKRIIFILSGLLWINCLAGCGAAPESSTVYSVAYTREEADGAQEEATLQENFKLYEEFGMTYDPVKKELWYNGKLVRWFEDYYPVGDGEQAGVDFFNENGTVDVYAVRDLSSLVQYADGSFDPSGKVAALKEFSDQEFATRDINAIKNPPIIEATAVEGETLTVQEAQKIAAEYVPFGVTYDVGNGQWYFNGEKVRYFLDILISNGEGLSSGHFQGAMRNSWNDDGTVDIYTVRDFNKRKDDGTGTLTAVEKYSQQEFDSRTQSSVKGSLDEGAQLQ